MAENSNGLNGSNVDNASYTNPFTNVTYKRGELEVKVNSEELVGKRAQEIVARQKKVIPSTTKPDYPAIMDPTHIALGPFISSLGDNLYFDAVLNVGTSAVFGYNHPNIFPKLQKIGTCLAGYIGAGTDFFFDLRNGAPTPPDLAEAMTALAGEAYGGEYMMNFSNAGTEANENSLKVAMFRKFRQIKKQLSDELYRSMCEQLGIYMVREDQDNLWSNYPFFVVAFSGAFHGRTSTSNTISMSKSRQKEGYQSVPYVVHAPYDSSVDFDKIIDWTPLETLIKENRLKAVIESHKAPADLVACLIVEPVQGEGGHLIPDAEFLQKLSDFVGKMRPKGMCFVSDEVQTGLYRTGEFTGMQNWFKNYPNLRPDIMSFAKPLHVGGSLIDKKLLEDWPSGKFSGTWAEGNLLGIAMACFTLDQLKEIDPVLGRPYSEHCKESGKYLRGLIEQLGTRLESQMPGTKLILNTRGLGQMNAFDVPDHDFQTEIQNEAFLQGLHILGTGDRSIRIFGTVDQRKREAEILVKILGNVIEKIATKTGSKSKLQSA
ncbi:MAG: aminotransferase class III-fold pyridoxal phosphate-dependent enzyme [Candidatus Melainabacteria bacterium]|nr:aminotransferase class III-fold pyridoxal phosphate-dependent enzyme [Candidatus Melainabacteria bacterium]